MRWHSRQLPLSEVTKRESVQDFAFKDRMRGVRDKNLPGLGRLPELDYSKRRSSQFATGLTHHTSGVDGGGDLRLLRCPDPVALLEDRADVCGCADRISGGGEDAHRLVGYALYQPAFVCAGRLGHDPVVLGRGGDGTIVSEFLQHA